MIKGMALTVVFLFYLTPVFADDSAKFWEDLGDEITDAPKELKKRQEDVQAMKERVNKGGEGNNINVLGDTKYINDFKLDIEKGVKRIRSLCAPNPEDLLTNVSYAAATSHGLMDQQVALEQKFNQIKKIIDEFTPFVVAYIEGPVFTEEEKDNKLLELDLESLFNKNITYKIMTYERKQDEEVSNSPLLTLWFIYAHLKQSLGSMTTGISQTKNITVARAAMASVVGSRLQTFYPGSTLSCTTGGNGVVVQGMIKIIYKDFMPIVIEEISPPFKYTYNLANFSKGQIDIFMQRDDSLNTQYSLSVSFFLENNRWSSDIRTVNIGTGITRTQSEQTADRQGNKQLTDDAETVKHLNWYYKKAFSETLCKEVEFRDRCNMWTFFNLLTNRSASANILNTDEGSVKRYTDSKRLLK